MLTRMRVPTTTGCPPQRAGSCSVLRKSNLGIINVLVVNSSVTPLVLPQFHHVSGVRSKGRHGRRSHGNGPNAFGTGLGVDCRGGGTGTSTLLLSRVLWFPVGEPAPSRARLPRVSLPIAARSSLGPGLSRSTALRWLEGTPEIQGISRESRAVVTVSRYGIPTRDPR